MLLAVLLPAEEAEADAAEVMRCSTGRHLCGANRPAAELRLIKRQYALVASSLVTLSKAIHARQFALQG